MRPAIINLAIVDDHVLIRKVIADYLTQNSINIHIQSSDVIDLLGKLHKSSTDILLMDLFLPKIHSLDALRVIRNEFPDMKIIVFSMNADLQLISNILDYGIHAYISKSDEPENLLQAIISVYDNRIYRNKILTEALYWNKQNNAKNGKDNFTFDERERKILQLLWEEKSNKEIANEIFLSVRSVEKIRQDMKEKLNVKSTIGLLKYALKSGEFSINPEQSFETVNHVRTV